MPRSRMIKPSFWDDAKLAKISFCARLTYIALWNFSDDFGVVKGDSRYLKNQIYPYDKIPIQRFEKWLNELAGLDRIFLFEHNDEAFFYMPKFEKHQKVDRPTKSYANPRPSANDFKKWNQVIDAKKS